MAEEEEEERDNEDEEEADDDDESEEKGEAPTVEFPTGRQQGSIELKQTPSSILAAAAMGSVSPLLPRADGSKAEEDGKPRG